MLGGLKLSSCAIGVTVKSFIASCCMLSHSCVYTKRMIGIKPVVEAFMNKRRISTSTGDVSAPVAARRERASIALCLSSAL